jgi:drug/metabolite transporter (DMT)-like permease
LGSRWISTASLVLAMMLWASSFVVLKLAFRSYDPMVVIFGRMSIAGLVFLALGFRFRSIPYRRGDLKAIAFMTLCEPCLYFIFEARAIELTTASQAGMISALLPLLVAVNARIFLKEALSVKTLTGFVIAVCGAVWLSVTGQSSAAAPNPLLGNFLEFAAMLCATGYIITLKNLTVRYSPFVLTGFQALAGSIFYFPLLFLPSTDLPLHFDLGGAMAIVYLGIFISLGAYGLYNYGVSRIPASQASAFVNLIPIFTLLLSRLILGESFSFMQCVAAAMIFLGVFLSQLGSPERRVRLEPKVVNPVS